MKVELQVVQEFDVKTLEVKAQVRYWEDAEVNGQEDTEGSLIPCRNGDTWEPSIDIETGQILNWVKGKSAKVHYKVCDAGTYTIKGEKGCEIRMIDGYVPGILSPGGLGYGDYIIMNINEEGFINKWKCSEELIKEQFSV